VGEAGGGIAAVVGGGLSTIGTIAAGAAIAGGVASAIGAATGNSALAKIGGIVGAAGGLATGADLLTSLSTPTDIASAVPASTTQAAMSTSDLNALTDTTQEASQAATSGTQAATSANNALTAAGGTPINPQAAATPGGYNMTAPNPTAPTGSAAGLPSGSATDSVVAGTNGVSDPTVAPQSNIAPGGVGATGPGSPALGTDVVPASTTQAAMSTSGLNALTNTTQTQSPGLLDNLLNSAQKNPLLAAQVGSGVIGGIANYLAPSPAQKAQIALENAETQRQQQIISLTAQRNANIAAGASQPQFKPGVVNPNTPAPSTTGSPGIGMPSLNNAPGNAYSLNNSPTANPGLLANAGAPVGS
jgi:hypothetical protein